MLTPTDIHLIVGSFCKLTTPDNVDIVLGEMVYDKASKRKRDIDIGIKYFNEKNEEVVFAGLQVKDHTRKLGSPEVEQLCLHFKDSESIKRGGIVSSSGFTKPGINKAAYHGIDLYEFRDYDPSKELNHVRPSSENFLTEVKRQLVQPPRINFVLDSENENLDSTIPLKHELRIFNQQNESVPQLATIDDLAKKLINNLFRDEKVVNLLNQSNLDTEIPLNVIFPIENIKIEISDGNLILLKEVGISCVVSRVSTPLISKFKILSKLNDPSENVGAAICELSNGMLACFATSEIDKSLKLMMISLPDRLRNKINDIKIKTTMSNSASSVSPYLSSEERKI